MSTLPFKINQFFNQFRQKSATVFNKTPHMWQVEVGGGILWSRSDNILHNQLLVRKTGEGKSLVYLVTGACIGGVTLCISPLLSLAMDQSRKVIQHSPNSNMVSSFHLDEMSPTHLNKLQTSLFHLPTNVSTSIFTSPQCFRNWHRFRNFLLQRNLVKFVVVDEIHFFAQFGNTFQAEFGHLKQCIFDKLHVSETKIPTLFMTATCTPSMLRDMELISGFSINHCHWPSPIMMSHRSVGIKTRNTCHHFKLIKTMIDEAISPSLSRPTLQRKVLIYTPARTCAKFIAEQLGDHFDTTPNFPQHWCHYSCWYYGQRREGLLYPHAPFRNVIWQL